MPFYIIMRRHIRKSVLSRYGVVMENRFVISVKHRFITSPVQKSQKYALELSFFLLYSENSLIRWGVSLKSRSVTTCEIKIVHLKPLPPKMLKMGGGNFLFEKKSQWGIPQNRKRLKSLVSKIIRNHSYGHFK